MKLIDHCTIYLPCNCGDTIYTLNYTKVSLFFCLWRVWTYKKTTQDIEEIDQSLRALGAPVKELGPIPSTHMAVHSIL